MPCPSPALSSVDTRSIWTDVPSGPALAHVPSPAAGKHFFCNIPSCHIQLRQQRQASCLLHHVTYSYRLVPLHSQCSQATSALLSTPPELSWFGTTGIFSGLGKIVPSFPTIVKNLGRAVREDRCGSMQAHPVMTGGWFTRGCNGSAPCSTAGWQACIPPACC